MTGARREILLPMYQQPYHLHIHRNEPARNMARFYELSISSILFGDVSLTRSWGRIGTKGPVPCVAFMTARYRAWMYLGSHKHGNGSHRLRSLVYPRRIFQGATGYPRARSLFLGMLCIGIVVLLAARLVTLLSATPAMH